MNRHSDSVAAVIGTRVPCALSTTGTHILSIGVDENKQLVFINAPCVQHEQAEVWKSAHGLEATTCVSVALMIQKGFRANLATAKDVRDYLENGPSIHTYLRKALFELWLTSWRTTTTRIEEADAVSQDTKTSDDIIYMRKIDAMTARLCRYLAPRSNVKFSISGSVVKELGLGIVNRNESLWWRQIAEMRGDKFVLLHDAIKPMFHSKIGISSTGYCIFCNAKYQHPVRHTRSDKHRLAVMAEIRQAVNFLNTDPQINKLLQTL